MAIVDYSAEPRGMCNGEERTISGLDGWWGPNATRITDLTQCRTDDFPAGLHWIRYKHPVNESQPDEVSNCGRKLFSSI